jgi:hypothetical protein
MWGEDGKLAQGVNAAEEGSHGSLDFDIRQNPGGYSYGLDSDGGIFYVPGSNGSAGQFVVVPEGHLAGGVDGGGRVVGTIAHLANSGGEFYPVGDIAAKMPIPDDVLQTALRAELGEQLREAVETMGFRGGDVDIADVWADAWVYVAGLSAAERTATGVARSRTRGRYFTSERDNNGRPLNRGERPTTGSRRQRAAMRAAAREAWARQGAAIMQRLNSQETRDFATTRLVTEHQRMAYVEAMHRISGIPRVNIALALWQENTQTMLGLSLATLMQADDRDREEIEEERNV